MPVSPRRNDVEEQTPSVEGSNSTGGGPTYGKKKRKDRQRRNKLYGILREEMQLDGTLPTTPEGAKRSEVVDPRLQGCQQLPELIRQALKENWGTPDAAKPAILGALLEPFFACDVVLDKDGNQVKVPPDRRLLIELARTLKQLDQAQWERDHPEEAGRAKGGSGNISIQTNLAAAQLIRDLVKSGQLQDTMQEVQGHAKQALLIPGADQPTRTTANEKTPPNA